MTLLLGQNLFFFFFKPFRGEKEAAIRSAIKRINGHRTCIWCLVNDFNYGRQTCLFDLSQLHVSGTSSFVYFATFYYYYVAFYSYCIGHANSVINSVFQLHVPTTLPERPISIPTCNRLSDVCRLQSQSLLAVPLLLLLICYCLAERGKGVRYWSSYLAMSTYHIKRHNLIITSAV